mmetsp:Transcript_42355/g.92268  ORF Transcript_42355/g.92268 Transcript_42355/m.92268 type:complete len:131 (+) Transcript_42355:120-512(+)
MPKFYCEYCDMYLTHSGKAGRYQHLTGRRHINNKIEYYQTLIREKGLTPPIYAPPPGMVLPMPKLGPPPAMHMGGFPGLPGLPGMPQFRGGFPGMPPMGGGMGGGGMGNMGNMGNMSHMGNMGMMRFPGS